MIIWGVFLGFSFIAIYKSKAIHKRLLYIVFICISAVLFTASTFLPLENFFITFNSPEEVYKYYNFGKTDIELVIEGNNCDFVVDRKNDADNYLIVPKTADGWKIGVGSNAKIIAQNITDGIVIYVYQYKDTNDYFITVLDTKGGESKISDGYETNFYSLDNYDDVLNKTFVSYYAHIANFDPQYNIVINGEKINLQN